jgi:Fe-S-cluster containining protein
VEYDCRKCGACCYGSDVLLDQDEVCHFSARTDLLPLIHRHERTAAPPLHFMKRSQRTDCCLALDGTLRDCSCSIYAQRPRLCRELEPGTEYCLAARRRMGIDAE